jgi:aminomuconate-semialdehyde/2-hydroxymuconate-6-semialdehyde dehydrogenase
MQKLANYINGELVPAVSDQWIDSFEPATGKVHAQAPDSDAREVDHAVQAAQKAFPSWSKTPAEERCRLLLRVADLIDRDHEELARAESIDSGKPLSLAREVDIPRSARNFRFFAGAAVHFASEAHTMEETALNYTLRQPIGVAGCISPWNLPLYLFTWKIAPALAAGNCVIGKPSELTPVTAWRLGQLAREAGLPPGVLNIVHGYGAKVGQAIVEHSAVPVISFTGGTQTGAAIASAAAPRFKKLALEMGGKNPSIIFADATFSDAVATTVRSAFSNQGEICLCGSRILIEQATYGQFRNELVSRARALRIGDPLEPSTQVGALVSKGHMEKVLSYIDLARSEGGKILCGGKAHEVGGRCRDGWFVEPTIIEDLPPTCRTNQEEIFGPVATLLPFDREEDLIRDADCTPYGLAAMIWTNDLSRAHRVAAQIHSGIVWINCWMVRDLRTPFGGMKQSGLGAEGGLESLRFFTQPKNVCVKL